MMKLDSETYQEKDFPAVPEGYHDLIREETRKVLAIGSGGRGKLSWAWAFTIFTPASIKHGALAQAVIFFSRLCS